MKWVCMIIFDIHLCGGLLYLRVVSCHLGWLVSGWLVGCFSWTCVRDYDNHGVDLNKKKQKKSNKQNKNTLHKQTII